MLDLLEQFIPAKYWGVIVALLPLVGRTYYSLINGAGLRGWWRAIYFGKSIDSKPQDTNKPPTA